MKKFALTLLSVCTKKLALEISMLMINFSEGPSYNIIWTKMFKIEEIND